MKHKNTYEDYLLKAKQICAIKEICSFDMQKKLENMNLKSNETQKIIKYLIDNKYIDNHRYAMAFANDKLKFNKWGKYKIKVYLKQKKISDEFINDAINNIDDKVYFEICNKEIEKKIQSIKGNSKYEIKAKLLRFITGKGFETDMSLEIINNKISSNI